MHNDTIASYEDQVTPRKKSGKSLLALALALILATGAFFSGVHIGGLARSGDGQGLSVLLAGDAEPDPDADLKEFWRVWDLLDEKFAFASTSTILTPEEKVAGAIDGLVRAYGDPYTTYFPPQEAEAFNEDISGNFSGVGMEVGYYN